MDNNEQKVIKTGFEYFFESLARFTCRNRLVVIIVTLLFAALMIHSIPKLTTDGSIEGFLRDSDETLLTYNEFRHQFGQDGVVLIAIHPPEIFDLDFLNQLKKFHMELEKSVPYIEDITSLWNVRYTFGNIGDFEVNDLLAEMPEDEEAMQKIKNYVLTNEIYENLLISKDGTFTTVTLRPFRYSRIGESKDPLVGFVEDDSIGKINADINKQFLTPQEIYELVDAVNKVVQKYDAPDFKLYVSGSPVVSNKIIQMMVSDMPFFTRICILLTSILLFAIMRRFSFMFLPIIIVALSLFSVFGLMAAIGSAIKPPTQILLSILIVAGICDTVHFMSIFFKKLSPRDSKDDRKKEKDAAIIYAFGHCGTPVLFTSLTTAAGMFALATSDLSPIADLGVFGGIGVILAMVFTMLLIPPILSLLPIKPKKTVSSVTLFDRVVIGLGRYSNQNPWKVLACAGILVLISAIGIIQLQFYHNSLLWLPEDLTVRMDTQKIDNELKGTVNLEVIVDTGVENGLHDYDTLTKLYKLSKDMQHLNNQEVTVGKSISISHVLKEVNRALNENSNEYYSIPEKNLIKQEFLLFESSGSDDLEDFIDASYQKARFTVRVPWLEAGIYTRFISDVREAFYKVFEDKFNINLTGMMAIFSRTSTAVMKSMAESYFLSIIFISTLLIIILRSLKLGLTSMIPNFLPIIIMLGIMGFFSMPLDTFSMLVGSIVLGLVVDDTIHFYHNFSLFFKRTNDISKSIELTLTMTGRPMVITSFILIISFSVYILSSMNNVTDFGFIMSITVFMALLADLMVSPALVTLLYSRKNRDK